MAFDRGVQVRTRLHWNGTQFGFTDDPALSDAAAAAANGAAWARLLDKIALTGPSLNARARVEIEPQYNGVYRFNEALDGLDFTDLILHGSGMFSLIAAAPDATRLGAFLTLGTNPALVTYGDAYPTYHVRVQTLAAHRYWSVADGGTVDPDKHAGIRFRGMYSPRARASSSYFPIGIQLFPDPGKMNAYGDYTFPDIQVSRIGLDLRGNTSLGWVNEHKFYLHDVISTSSLNNYGSVAGVRFSAEVGGYTGQNNIRFDKPCFQLATGTEFPLSTAVLGGSRYRHLGHEYVVTVAGTTGGSAPVHTDGSTVTSGTASIKHVGRFYRVPLHFDGAGAYVGVDDARYEGGYGSVVKISGTTPNSGVGLRMGLQYFGWTAHEAPLYGVNTMVEIDQRGTSTTDEISRTGIKSAMAVTLSEDSRGTYSMRHDDIGAKAIIGAKGLQINGAHFWNHFSPNAPARYVDETVVTGPDVAAHGENGLYWTHAQNSPTFRFRLSNNCRAFRFDWLGEYPKGNRWAVYATDSTNTVVTHTLASPAVATDSGHLTTSYNFTVASGDTYAPFTAIATKSEVTCLNVRMQSGMWRGFELGWSPTYLDWTASGRDNGIALAPLYSAGPNDSRISRGTPISGVFTQGEFIANSAYNGTTDTTKGWNVTSSGRKAWPWTTAQVVVQGTTRSNASKIYVATNGGTAGATAPTHSSGTVTDGTVTWRYLSAEAVMLPEYDNVSADKGDAAATLTPYSSEKVSVWNTVLTADRAVTLSTTNATNGYEMKIVRTAAATGAFNLNVGTGPLKALATAGTWCKVTYNGSAWVLTEYGTL